MKIYIETDRLIIREHLPEDFEAVFEMDRDAEVRLYTGGVSTLSRDEAFEKHLRYCNKGEDELKEYAVVLKETGEYIGYCGFQYCDILKGIGMTYVGDVEWPEQGLVKKYEIIK